MGAIDLAAETDINASPADIAAVMFDPAREPEWVGAISGVEVIDPALAPGARVRHTGSVMGREFVVTTAVDSLHFPHVLALRVSEGQFEGLVRFDIQRSGEGSRVRIRAAGESPELGGFKKMLIEGPARSGMAGALKKLKDIVERAR
jgi:uncharacterized protein YndB with AHSA1/START domain